MFVEQILKIILLVACVTCASVHPPMPRLDGRIVGGFAINITQAPWQVSLQKRHTSTTNYFHFCGASIISSTWLATAAHCTANLVDNPSELLKLRVRTGSSYRNQSGELLSVKRVVQHPNVNTTLDYDFSLLELEKPLRVDATKQPIQLHNFDEVFPDNTTLFVSGWGSTQNPNESNLQLRGAKVPLVNQKKCQEAYSFMTAITPRMICAGFYEQGGKDSCSGDSGGPLVGYSQDDGKPRLVGIVSWGNGCALPKFPGVYSRILAARDWISINTGI